MSESSVSPNRDLWNKISDWYQTQHGPQLARAPKAWGSWSVPESKVQVLGDLSGLRVLELGCGGGQWSGALADDGVRIIGLDLSEQQLTAALRSMRTGYEVVQAAAEDVPFADSSFDLIFCDHGAMSWGYPYRTVPEAARVLRAGGRLVFSTGSPWMLVCYEDETDRIGTSLRRSYFDLYRQPEQDGASTYTLQYGAWIRLFRLNGFVVEDLIELRPDAGAATSYYEAEPRDWPHHWPAECLWVARRA